MISFSTETTFELPKSKVISIWLSSIILNEDYSEGEISIVFCNDDYLHKLNMEFLNHDTLTDVISFDYSIGKQVHGEIFISVDRVKENATEFNQSFETELSRVIAHGVLHFCGYKDKTDSESSLMRTKEGFYLQQLMDKPF
jgi:rRNA maturation RNase YbeY